MKRLIICLTLCLMTLTLCVGVGAEQAQANGEVPQNTASSTETEENVAAADTDISEEIPRGVGEVLLSVWEEHSAEVFSALTLLGSLVVAFTYKRGLLPTLYGALNSIGNTAKEASERAQGLATEAQEHILSLEGIAQPVARGMEALGDVCTDMSTRLTALETLLAKEEDERARIKCVMEGVADMLWGVFTAANLPEYAKEQIGVRYNAIKSALADGEDIRREESTPV